MGTTGRWEGDWRPVASEAIGSIKLAVYGGIDRPLDEGLESERTLVEPLFESEDAREGISAFMEKRKPVFGG